MSAASSSRLLALHDPPGFDGHAPRDTEEDSARPRGAESESLACVGKTHLAVAVLRGLIEKGAHCVFREYGSLL
jgi:hypothetical protein